jgi:hypothetical protein
MKLLDAINITLRGAGKAAIHSIDLLSQDASIALRVIREVRTDMLSEGYKFNTREVDFAVDNSGKVPVPTTYLDVRFEDEELVIQEDEGDNKLYVWNTDDNDWHGEAIEDVVVVFDLGTDPSKEQGQFSRLPEKLAYAIARRAAAQYFEEVNSGQPSPILVDRANKASGRWVNSQEYANLKQVSGFSAIRAKGAGGTVSSWNPRTQTYV